jgi:hypothetical protein
VAALSIQTATTAGFVPSFASAAGGGDTFANTYGDVVLYVVNGAGAPITVTIDSPTTCSQGGTHDVAVAVTNGTRQIIGPFAVSRFSSTVSVTYSSATSVTVAAVRVPRAD